MLRHPPASIVVTHKDVDELATMQRELLNRVQSSKLPATPGNGGSRGTAAAAGPAVPGRGGARQVAFDGHGAERQRRQQMSVSERLGL
ncbi:hypothetical protein IWW37_000593 [Coemansia sp. RSA 2050]|nr:hypothetical protein IWW37_000593 [Coemansia sp. RSA 2050]